MAHILIPTDFSDSSLNAAVYAVRLFGTGHRYTVLNTHMMPHGASGMIWEVDALHAQSSKESLALFLDRLRAAVPGVQPELVAAADHGDLPNVVARYAAGEDPPMMVVMGTQGASGLQEVLFGSNTASVIKEGGLPVLAVPAQAEYRSPKRMMLADDGGPVEKKTLAPLIDIARRSNGEVVVVRVLNEETTPDVAGSTQLYDWLLGAIPHTQQHLSGEDVEAALNELADQSDADLLAVLHRDRGVFDRLFHRSTAVRLAMHTHLPLLVMQQAPR